MRIRPYLAILAMMILFAPGAGAQWSTNGTNVYYNNGRVGIGTTAPLGQLQVYGGNAYLWGLNLGYGTNPAVITTDDNSKGISLQIAGVEYARLHNNGNFGIGTTTPQSLLDVRGTANTYGLLINSLTGGDNVLRTKNGTNTYDLIGTYSGWDAAAVYIAGYNSTSTTNATTTQRVFIGNPTFNNNYFEFDVTKGAAGIGTKQVNDPNYRLFVETGIRTRKIVVDQANWPDYVFHPTYHLPSLESVRGYIETNHHLPEVPSAGEVEKAGVDLGANTALLLKKIEELTLYVIQENKELEAVKKELEASRERIKALEERDRH